MAGNVHRVGAGSRHLDILAGCWQCMPRSARSQPTPFTTNAYTRRLAPALACQLQLECAKPGAMLQPVLVESAHDLRQFTATAAPQKTHTPLTHRITGTYMCDKS